MWVVCRVGRARDFPFVVTLEPARRATRRRPGDELTVRVEPTRARKLLIGFLRHLIACTASRWPIRQAARRARRRRLSIRNGIQEHLAVFCALGRALCFTLIDIVASLDSAALSTGFGAPSGSVRESRNQPICATSAKPIATSLTVMEEEPVGNRLLASSAAAFVRARPRALRTPSRPSGCRCCTGGVVAGGGGDGGSGPSASWVLSNTRCIRSRVGSGIRSSAPAIRPMRPRPRAPAPRREHPPSHAPPPPERACPQAIGSRLFDTSRWPRRSSLFASAPFYL